MKQKLYFENLDGLRFLAFFSVFLFHSFYTPIDAIKNDQVFSFIYRITRYGWLGVNFFFVLSGFLITYLLLLEERNNGKINVFKFYIRRILRIWPLYYLIVIFCFVVYPIISAKFAQTPDTNTPDIALFIFHLSNYNYIYYPSEIPTLNILWSISIEEQFYLIFPLILLIVKGKNRFIILPMIILLSLIFQWWHKDNFHYHHHHILTCMADLTIGCLSALLVLNVKGFLSFFQLLKLRAIALVYVIMTFYFVSIAFNLFANYTLVTSFCFAFVILEQNYSKNSPFKISNIPIISSLGKYTYGLYCYHYLALLLAIKISQIIGLNETVFGVLVFENALGITISIIIAITSYYTFELPFLKLKNRYSFYIKSTTNV